MTRTLQNFTLRIALFAIAIYHGRSLRNAYRVARPPREWN